MNIIPIGIEASLQFVNTIFYNAKALKILLQKLPPCKGDP
jgi:hypothetical protein